MASESDAAWNAERRGRISQIIHSVGGGIITGAADDDPSAIGTYASAGARFGLAFLWVAPVLLPMMFVVTYLSAKLGRVYGAGLFTAVRNRYSKRILYPLMVGAVIGNVIEAAADLGGIGAALNLLIPLPITWFVVAVALMVICFQIFGSYSLLRRLFRWLALALFAYIVAGLLAGPNLGDVLQGTLMPRISFNSDFLSMLVACIGTSLSAYIYTWQSNQEVEDQIAEGLRHQWQRRGASRGELARTQRDVAIGMIFSNIILYFIILSTGATLHLSGQTHIDTAASAAAALEPISGPASKVLFALGVAGVGMLAIPVMTTGAAYDLAQSLGHKSSLHTAPSEAKLFYVTIALVMSLAVLLNFFGFNPMQMLVWSGIVQGFSVPPLLLLIVLMTNDKALMGEHANGVWTNLIGFGTVGVTLTCAVLLCIAWF